MAEFNPTEIIYDISSDGDEVYVVVVPAAHWHETLSLLNTYIGREIEHFPAWEEYRPSIFFPGLTAHQVREALGRIGCVESKEILVELKRKTAAEQPLRDQKADPTAADRLLGPDFFGEDD